MSPIQNPIQKQIQKLLDEVVAAGDERGVQVTAYLEGRLVVDAWAGVADVTTGRPVDGETLFPVFSTTKGIAATVLHGLVEKGKLAYTDPVAKHWPEFASHGKQAITVAQVLSHSAGLPYMPAHLSVADINDGSRMCATLADQTPAWTPGSRLEYHAVNFGWLVGELARRVDGRPFAQIMQEEICRPLGITGMFVGIPESAQSRVALLEEPAPAAIPNNAAQQSVAPAMMPLHAWMNRPDVRRACIPASNGIMTARAVARHYAALLPGGVDGIELLPPARIRAATVLQNPAHQPDAELPIRVGYGYFVGGGPSPFGKRLTAFGHGGYGGSIGFADPEKAFACGLTKNLFSKNAAHGRIIQALREGLGIAS